MTQSILRPGPLVYEVPASARDDMRVPARFFADEELWSQIRNDRSVEQLMNVATLPGISECAYAMPDVHQGYGFPVGGVAAFRISDGVISPGGVGYDINCGVRLLASELTVADLRGRLEDLVHNLSRSVPSGTGRGGELRLTDHELDRVFVEGCKYLVERGLALPEDIDATESGGSLPQADPTQVSQRARQRGSTQLGTLGSGNHFVEIQTVEQVFDTAAAEVLGLETGRITVLIHTGSRGLGHQVCTDYVREMDRVMPKYGIELPDRELACAPFDSPEGRAYFGAMCSAANFAWSNRQTITHTVRGVFERAFGDAGRLRLVYDVAHNIAKVEEYGGEQFCVHRKGATRAFGPNNPEIPEIYRSVGQPVFIPGSMGTASWVLVGAEGAMTKSFGSTCHGAGRRMSRRAAKRIAQGHEVRRELAKKGIVVRCHSNSELAEEAPHAYKDVDRVVDVVDRMGLARKVARLKP
ncbi:MAG: RtcB family protein, partial [Gemmatimonadetes bacterium]|nr:RtcB family protein [Gemmatimonadota bacterium]